MIKTYFGFETFLGIFRLGYSRLRVTEKGFQQRYMTLSWHNWCIPSNKVGSLNVVCSSWTGPVNINRLHPLINIKHCEASVKYNGGLEE